MGKLTEMQELKPAEFALNESAELMRRTVEALTGASEAPVIRVKVPSGGSRFFEGLGDEDHPVNRFTGVILDARYVNAYFDSPMGEGGANRAPACMSADGISGWDSEGMEHACRTCYKNRMGSRDGGRGKACKNMAQLTILIEGEPLPVMLRVPTMSVNNYSVYVTRELVTRGLKPCQVATEFKLVKAVNAGGIEYSQIQFSCAGRVDDSGIQSLMVAVRQLLMGGAEMIEEGENNG